MRAGWVATRRKSIEAPTAMKKRPSRRPLKGSTSLSSSWRYSLLARTTPARNVPRAGERPTRVMRRAMPITSSSAAAVKSSRRRVAAIARKTGRRRKRAPSTTTPTTARTARVCPPAGSPPTQVAEGPAPASAAAGRPRSGSRARIGITARSWKSRTAKELWPAAVLRSPLSASDCSTIAVEDMDRMSPTATASRAGCPKARPRAVITAVVAPTCRLPRPRIGPRSRHSRVGSSSSPTRKSIITTPNSAKCMTSWPSSPTSCRPKGPMATPARR